jgi:hypothetical protein
MDGACGAWPADGAAVLRPASGGRIGARGGDGGAAGVEAAGAAVSRVVSFTTGVWTVGTEACDAADRAADAELPAECDSAYRSSEPSGSAPPVSGS